ncbi:MAG: hypothetical protein U5L11_05420 [Arhodomonas sp.]|nr:hypothetical protein [Arhodomonas sp.]
MAVAMTGGGWGAVVISGLCLGLAPAGLGGALADVARVAWRLRYLLASIVFFYGWFSGADTGWWPDLQGLGEGARRALILMVMALGARRFLGGLRRERAAAGLFWLLAPLQHLRLPVRSFATRLVLVFDCLSELEIYLGPPLRDPACVASPSRWLPPGPCPSPRRARSAALPADAVDPLAAAGSVAGTISDPRGIVLI